MYTISKRLSKPNVCKLGKSEDAVSQSSSSKCVDTQNVYFLSGEFSSK